MFAMKRGYKYQTKILLINGLSAFTKKLMIILMDHKIRMQILFSYGNTYLSDLRLGEVQGYQSSSI